MVQPQNLRGKTRFRISGPVTLFLALAVLICNSIAWAQNIDVATDVATSILMSETGGDNSDCFTNTRRQSTLVRLEAATWTSSTAGQIDSACDVDHFQLVIPHAGQLIVETTGQTDTVGTVWQTWKEKVTGATGGDGRNFRLSTRVAAGWVTVAVESRGSQTGAYTLEVSLLVGFLENPGPSSFQSGIGVLSGWICDAVVVEVVLDDLPPQEAGYGTERLDTAGVCGDEDNGFGLLFNWNRLGDGEHTVRVLADGDEFGRATFTVTTLGVEFLRGVHGEWVVQDFPSPGEEVRLVWQEALQNFVIAPPHVRPVESLPGLGGGPVGRLGNPGQASWRSGIGVISGWVCDADVVELEINGTQRLKAAYGTERPDTENVCGDRYNGFGLLFNWNRLGDGDHTVRALADGEEFGRAIFTVTTLGEEFLRGVQRQVVVWDFPDSLSEVRLVWQEALQNFVIDYF